MKRLIWIVIVGLFVYWGATSDTLGNWITQAFNSVDPETVETIDQSVNESIDKLNTVSDEESTLFVNRFLLGMSCLALLLSVIYRFILKRTAQKRHLLDEINSLIILSAICIALTSFRHDISHWWAILTIPITSFAIIYPLYYIPQYKYFRWVAASAYDVLVLGLGFLCFFWSISNSSIIGIIMTLACTLIAFLYYHSHRKFDYCPKCHRYVAITNTERHIDKKTVEYQDKTAKVATGYITTYSIDKYGNKTTISKTPTGWKRIFYTLKITKVYYTDHLECPYCEHKFTKQDMEKSKREIAYKSREEKEGVYINPED